MVKEGNATVLYLGVGVGDLGGSVRPLPRGGDDGHDLRAILRRDLEAAEVCVVALAALHEGGGARAAAAHGGGGRVECRDQPLLTLERMETVSPKCKMTPPGLIKVLLADYFGAEAAKAKLQLNVLFL